MLTRVGSAFGPYRWTMPQTFFAPDGSLVLGLQGSAIEWPMDTETWEGFACRVAARDLTRTEWHDVLPDRPRERVCPTGG